MPTLILLPTYNEAENLPELVRELRRTQPDVELLFIDDSSPDGTAEVVKRCAATDGKIHLLLRSEREGIAAAYLAGFAWGLERGYDRFVQMDADFSHEPAALASLLAALDVADVAVGTRYVDGGGTIGWSRFREAVSRFGNFYARTLLSLPFRDLTGGFTAWRASALKRVGLGTVTSRGYVFQAEMKLRAFDAGCRLQEVPIRFHERRHGYSKMSPEIAWEALFHVIRLRRNRRTKKT